MDTIFLQSAEELASHGGPDEPNWQRDRSALLNVAYTDVPRCFLWRAAWAGGAALLLGPRQSYAERCNTSTIFIQRTVSVQWLLHLRIGTTLQTALEADPAVWPRVPADLTLAQLLGSFSAPVPALARAAQSALNYIPPGETQPCFTALPTDDVAASAARSELLKGATHATVLTGTADRPELIASSVPLNSDVTIAELLRGSTVLSHPDLVLVLHDAEFELDLAGPATHACQRALASLERVVRTLPFVDEFSQRAAESERGAPPQLPPARRAAFNREVPSVTEALLAGAVAVARHALELRTLARPEVTPSLCRAVIELCSSRALPLASICSLLEALPPEAADHLAPLCSVLAAHARPSICVPVLKSLLIGGPATAPAIVAAFLRALTEQHVSPVLAVRMGSAAGLTLLTVCRDVRAAAPEIVRAVGREVAEPLVEELEAQCAAIGADERAPPRVVPAALTAWLSLALLVTQSQLGVSAQPSDLTAIAQIEDGMLSECLASPLFDRCATLQAVPDVAAVLTLAVRALHACLCSSTHDVADAARQQDSATRETALHASATQLVAGCLASRLALMLMAVPQQLVFFSRSAHQSLLNMRRAAHCTTTWTAGSVAVFAARFHLASCLKRMSSACELALLLLARASQSGERRDDDGASDSSDAEETGAQLDYLRRRDEVAELVAAGRTTAVVLLLLAECRSALGDESHTAADAEVPSRGLEVFYSVRRLSVVSGRYRQLAATAQRELLAHADPVNCMQCGSCWDIAWDAPASGWRLHQLLAQLTMALLDMAEPDDCAPLILGLLNAVLPPKDAQRVQPYGPTLANYLMALSHCVARHPTQLPGALAQAETVEGLTPTRLTGCLATGLAQALLPARRAGSLPVQLPLFLPAAADFAQFALVVQSLAGDAPPELPEDVATQAESALEQLRAALFAPTSEHFVREFFFEEVTLRQAVFDCARALLALRPQAAEALLAELGPVVTAARRDLPVFFRLSPQSSCFSAAVAGGVGGIVNPGCVCYMNSALQLLESVAPLRAALLRWSPPPPAAEPEPADRRRVDVASYQRFAEALREFLLMLSVSPCEMDPNALHQLWPQKGFDVFEQHDSYEAYQVVLDSLERAFAGTPLACALDALFGIGVSAVMEPVAGSACAHVFSRPEKQVALKAQLVADTGAKVTTLEQALRLGLAPTLYDTYRCRECGVSGPRQRRSVLVRLPPFLVVNVERSFGDAMGRMHKILHKVECPALLDLAELTATPDVPARYRLVGAVVHTGSFDFGHYWYYGSRPRAGVDQRGPLGLEARLWTEYNDTHVAPVSPQTVAHNVNGSHHGASGFLLLYESLAPVPADEGLTPDELLAQAREECASVSTAALAPETALRRIERALAELPVDQMQPYVERAAAFRAIAPPFDTGAGDLYYTLLVTVARFRPAAVGDALHLLLAYLHGNGAAASLTTATAAGLSAMELGAVVRALAMASQPALVVAGPDSPLFVSEADFAAAMRAIADMAGPRRYGARESMASALCENCVFLKLLLQDQSHAQLVLTLYASSLRAQAGVDTDWPVVLRPLAVLLPLRATRLFKAVYAQLSTLLFQSNDYVALDAESQRALARTVETALSSMQVPAASV